MLKLDMKQELIYYFLGGGYKDADQTGWMRRLVYIFVVLMQQSQVFLCHA